MRKLGLVAFQQVWHIIRDWSYWFGRAMPLLLLGFLVLGNVFIEWVVATQKPDPAARPAPDAVVMRLEPFAEPVGYVDEARLITRLPDDIPAGHLIQYADQSQARAALAAGSIAGYYLVPANYLAGGQAVYYSTSFQLFAGTDKIFRDILTANLIVTDDPQQTWRAVNPADFEHQRYIPAGPALPASGTYTPIQAILGLGVILLVTMVLLAVGTYWLGFLVSERDQGTLELMLHSVSARQFVLGKLLGTLGLMILEFGSYLFWFWLSSSLLRSWQPSEPDTLTTGLNAIWGELAVPSSQTLALTAAALFCGQLVYSVILVICGEFIQTYEAAGMANNVAGGVVLLSFLGLFGVLIDPAGPLAVGLSLFPLSAPIFLPVRLLVSDVPLWQFGLSLGLMLGTTGLLLWLAVYLFQLKCRWGDNLWQVMVRRISLAIANSLRSNRRARP